MCFSATASFTAGAVLTAAGIRSLQLAPPKQRPYAAIPLLFGAQQAAEGVVWLTHAHAPMLNNMAMHAYLVFAFIVWPVWIPYAVYLMEQDAARKQILRSLTIIGSLYAISMLVFLAGFPLANEVRGHSIVYHLAMPGWLICSALMVYLIPVALPCFISSWRILHCFGAILLGSLVVSYIYWEYALTSVWCFFAALLSSCIWASLESKRMQNKIGPAS